MRRIVCIIGTAIVAIATTVVGAGAAASPPTLQAITAIDVNASTLGIGPDVQARLSVMLAIDGLPSNYTVSMWAEPISGGATQLIGGRWSGSPGHERWRFDQKLFPGTYDLTVRFTTGLNGGSEVRFNSAELASRGFTTRVVISNGPVTPTTTFHRSGYWLIDPIGTVYAFGDAPWLGQVGVDGPPGQHVVALLHRPGSADYDLFTDDGSSFDAPTIALAPWTDDTFTSYCALPRPPTGQRYVTAMLYPDAPGCWAFTDKGIVTTTTLSRNYGDLASSQPLNAPIIDAIATPSGHGYYLVAGDGGVFTFGDAAFHGSMGGHHLNGPVVGLVPDSDNVGYWLVASDGGIFAFDAGFEGSMGGTPLNKPIVGMVRYGRGYLMVGADGGVFNFSGLAFSGSLGGNPPSIDISRVIPLEE